MSERVVSERAVRELGIAPAYPAAVLIIERRRVAELLDIDACIQAVEHAFRLQGEGKTTASAALSFPVARGGFHVKAGLLDLGRPFFVVKTNGNFPRNPVELGLPTIQGVIVLADAADGRPLAVLDTIEITLQRTAAATAVAAKHLARRDSETVTICGCGRQAGAQLRALMRVLPIRRVLAYDRDGCRSDLFADEMAGSLGLEITPVSDLATAARASDVCVTCTTSTEFLLGAGDVSQGAFIAAVGADHPYKREIHPGLMARCRVVVDDLEQCAASGDLHHAIDAGSMTRSGVHADLAAVVAGRAAGRTSNDEITLFDSTGIALEDAAAAGLVYGRALADGRCLSVRLGE